MPTMESFPFTTVFFDVDCCLLDTHTSERRILKELYAKQGQQIGDETVLTYQSINRTLWQYLDRGEITREELYLRRFRLLFEQYPHVLPAEEAAPWFLEKLAHAYDPAPGAAKLLQRMKEHGQRFSPHPTALPL